MIRFTCECGRELQAPEEYAGKQAACPNCQRVNAVPLGDRPAPASEGVQVPRAQAPTEGVQADRPDEPLPERDEPRPRRRAREDDREPRAAPATSGKAVTSAILGALSVFCFVILFFLGLPAIILGALAIKDIGRNERALGGRGLAITGLVLGIVGSLLGIGLVVVVLLGGAMVPAVFKVREAAARMNSSNNIKQMGLALHNYESTYNGLPEKGAICDKAGKPLLSWRVAILPYIEQNNLFKQFRLDEPWDSAHNKRLLPMMPKTYVISGSKKAPEGMTYYRAFIGRGAIFDPTLGRQPRIADIADGTSNTLWIVEAAEPVEWTRPDDLPFDADGPLPPLGGHFRGGFNVGMADGSVRFVSEKTPEATIRAMITRSGAEVVDLP